MTKTMIYREVERALRAHDPRFCFERAKGSEIKLSHPDFREIVCLPHHGDGDIIGSGLLARIGRAFELPRDLFAPASPKAKPSKAAVAAAAFDVLKKRDRRDGYWSIRPSKFALSCHYFHWTPRWRFEHVLGVWFWHPDQQLTILLHGPRRFSYAGDLRKVGPEQHADMIERFTQAVLGSRPAA